MKVVKMEDAMQKMVKKEGEMEQRMDGLSNQISAVDKKVENVDADVISHDWKYFGVGVYGTGSESYKSKMPFLACIRSCEKHRVINGRAWNGLLWDPSSSNCWCIKNDQGHITEGYHYMHYKIE